MEALESTEPPLKTITGVSTEIVAAVMLEQRSCLVGHLTEKEIPIVAGFEQGVQALAPDVAEFAGSAARYSWLERIKALEEKDIGPIRHILCRLFGVVKGKHPLLQECIVWIEQRVDQVSVSTLMLLADLYMEVGQSEKAHETYAAAFQRHAQTQPEVPLME